MKRVQGTFALSGRDRGAVAVLTALLMVTFMVFLAFVVDIGLMVTSKARLQTAVDAGALAGAAELCMSKGVDPVTGEPIPVWQARNFARDNNVERDRTRAFVYPAWDAASPAPAQRITVEAREVHSMVFGSIIGMEDVALDARATAERSCRVTFQFISDTYIKFTGNDSGGGSWYAQYCFDGSNATFDLAAVSSIPEFNCKLKFTGGGWSDAVPPGPIQRTGEGTRRFYEAPLITTAEVIAANGWGAAIDQAVTGLASSNLCSQVTAAAFSDTVLCRCKQSGKCGPADALKLPDGIVDVAVFAEGDIDGKQNTDFRGPILHSIEGNITLNNGVAAGVIAYAPKGNVKFTGGSSSNSGYILANSINLEGNNLDAVGGVSAVFPGEFSLVE